MFLKKFFIFLLCLFLIYLYFLKADITFSETSDATSSAQTSSSESDKKLTDLQEQIRQYEQKVTELQSQSRTLSSQIKIVDNQIYIIELRMKETKHRIESIQRDVSIIKSKISVLERDIDTSTRALLGRITAVYEVGRMEPWQIFLTSDNISNFFDRLTYLRIVQIYDKKNIYAAEQAKVNFSNQKKLLEDKQKEEEALKKKLEGYTFQMAQEKKAKQDLLTATQNDEKKYQELLAQARSEFEAIQGIIAGKGDEDVVGKVEEGKKIASLISGVSCNSSGTHLHFIVSEGNNVQNPFNFLKGIDSQNCSGPGECSGADVFNPSGSWNWPLDSTIKFYQGYGLTWAIQHTWVGQIYNFHNGIDIGTTGSLDIKAVKNGTLYRGSYAGSNSCRLRYVKVKHDEGNIETYYLHVNYL